MKTSEIFEMTNEELNAKLKELKADLFLLRFKNATNQLANPKELTECKKDIARVMTVIRQRELNISVEPEKKGKTVSKRTKKQKAAK